MENPTSEGEDLQEQLARQEGVVEELRKKIKDEEGRISGYKEVLMQFQQRGNFVAPTSSAPFDKILQDDGLAAKCEELILENGFIRKEIECLNERLEEVDKDMDLLKISAIEERDANEDNQCNEYSNPERKTENISEMYNVTVRDSLTEFREALREVLTNIRLAERDRERAKLESEVEQLRVKILNEKMTELLRKSTEKVVDLDCLLMDSKALRDELSLESVEISRDSSALQVRRKGPNKILSCSDVANSLLTMKRNQHLRDQCTGFFQKLALGILETIEMKDRESAHQAADNKTLCEMIIHLLGHLNEEDEPESQEDTYTDKHVLETEGRGPNRNMNDSNVDNIDVDFEQPHRMEHRHNALRRQI